MTMRRLGALTVVVTVLTAALPQAAVGAQPAIVLAAGPPLVLENMVESVEYLTSTYGVGVGEAMRRLDIQRLSPQLADALSERFPDSYAGMWMDQEHGGTLVVNTTDTAATKAALREVGAVHPLRVNPVRHSLKELRAVENGLTQRFGNITTVDEVNNTVVVNLRSARALTKARGAKEVTAAEVPVQAGLVRVDEGNQPLVNQCIMTDCPPPMRGGDQARLYSSLTSGGFVGTCTIGFNVHGSQGWQYSVTAGHCFDFGAIYTQHHAMWVGYLDWSLAIGDLYPYDGAIMPYLVIGSTNYAVQWFPSGSAKNLVWARNQSNNYNYPIKGSYTYSQINYHWVACMSGSSSNDTKCGEVTDKDGGIVMNICTLPGDSGSPLYSQVDNKAYGIMNARTPGTFCDSSVRSMYTPLSYLFTEAKNNTGLTFTVNTA